ncbi:MAG: hypothetical protein HY975_00300, partial [Candidatus Kerfeldbacteria bacterium]|nr:hypothetical protein [Candidatus Kerfeldbacteria bacterium]
TISRLPLEATVGAWQQPLSKVTLGSNTVYRTAVVQGIEDQFQTALLDDNGWTLMFTASGTKLEVFPRLLASVVITPMACTQEAKVCADGSAVGRRGPRCEFDACPSALTNSNSNANTNTTAATNSSVNTNTATVPTNTNANTVVNPPSMTYTISTVTDKAAQFDDESVCLRGWYQSSFEFNALGPSISQDAYGNTNLAQPYIWIDDSAELEVAVTCDQNREGQRTCLGEIARVCGLFRYAAPGETGFGHVAAYRYLLQDPNVVTTGTMENNSGN